MNTRLTLFIVVLRLHVSSPKFGYYRTHLCFQEFCLSIHVSVDHFCLFHRVYKDYYKMIQLTIHCL